MSDVPAGKVPIFASVGVAYGYLRENWMRWLPASLILGVLMGFAQMSTPAMIAAQTGGSGGAGGYLFSMLAVWLFSIALTTGVLKERLRGEFEPPVGVTFKQDEMRVLGVQLGLSLIFGIIGFFVIFVISVAMVMAAARSGVDLESADPDALAATLSGSLDSGSALVMLILFAIVLAAVVFVYVRLILVQAATVGERKMMIFQTWGWTQGNFWRVLACALLVLVPLSVAGGLITAIVEGMLLGGTTPDAVAAASGPALFVTGMIAGTVNGLASVAMVALIAHLYQGLRPSQSTGNVFS